MSLNPQFENPANRTGNNLLIHHIAFFSETLSAELGIIVLVMKSEKIKNKLFKTITLNISPLLVYYDIILTSSCRDYIGLSFRVPKLLT